MTLTLFSRSQGNSDCWKMACPHLISRMNGWILTKLAHLYCCDMEKNWLDFGDLDPIFKVTQGLRLLKNGLSAPYLMKEWMDFDQTCTTVLLWHEKELIRFWWHWPHFQGLRMAQIVGKWLFCILSPEWMDGFWPNLYSYLLRQGQEMIRFFSRSHYGLDFGPHRTYTRKKKDKL